MIIRFLLLLAIKKIKNIIVEALIAKLAVEAVMSMGF